MCKKLLFIMILASLTCCGIINAQWRSERCSSSNNLNAISFTSLNSGWIVGDNGTLLYKTEYGWENAEKPTDENLYSIFMLNKNEGWTVGAKGTILHYIGNKWEPVLSPTENNLLSVSFKDLKNGIAVGEHGTILIYQNGIWRRLESGVRSDLLSTSVADGNIWIGGGLECVNVPILRMGITKGETLLYNYNSVASINSIEVLNMDDGWAVGSPSTILHFNGQIWEKPILNYEFPSLKSVFFSDANNGISVGYEGTILTFSDNSWKKESTNTTQDLNGAAIIEYTYYAVGDGGTILMKSLPMENRTDILNKISEETQLYPNPCNEYINIVTSLKSNENLVISITNASGQLMKHGVLNFNEGNLINQVFTGDLENGFYIIKTVNGNKLTSGKFIVKH